MTHPAASCYDYETSSDRQCLVQNASQNVSDLSAALSAAMEDIGRLDPSSCQIFEVMDLRTEDRTTTSK